ncbi:hypothetical protein [Leifsonia sp. NPDC058248]|uniref:hypothetical protein n=1 Tax=Leifsonia sp. NPDC058248 TaxID=3346402 RepID=UPI0036DACAB1
MHTGKGGTDHTQANVNDRVLDIVGTSPMNVRPGLGVVVLGLISVSLTGCIRIQPVDPDLTVEKAKAEVLAEGKRMVSLISEGLVEEYQQLDTTHLLSCTSDSDADLRGLPQ